MRNAPSAILSSLWRVVPVRIAPTGRTLRAEPTIRLCTALFLAVSVVLAALPAAAAGPGGDVAKNCFWQLAHGRGARLECTYLAWLTDQERKDLRGLTRDLLIDARCTVSVSIARKTVDRVLARESHIFEAPPQPVTCEVETSRGVIPITGTFAPRVTIADGRASEATPGLANVMGVNSYLAWPVVQYVNRSPGIRSQMTQMINLYLDRHVRKVSAGGR